MLATQAGPEHGVTLDSTNVERGLRELCKDLHFDMGAKIGQWHPNIQDRQGVFYNGRHICSMDRGPMPEFKMWSVVNRVVEVEWHEADKDDVSIFWRRIAPWSEGYEDLKEAAKRGNDPSLAMHADGTITKRVCQATRKVRGRCVRLGWRHTFERLLHEAIPGITRQSLGSKFGVDMLKYPVGPPDEVIAALLEE